MALETDFSDMKKTFVSYLFFLVIDDWKVSVPFGTPCIIVSSESLWWNFNTFHWWTCSTILDIFYCLEFNAHSHLALSIKYF